MNATANYLLNILRSNFSRLPGPNKITYILTSRCNLRCKSCSIWKKPPREELSVAEIDQIFSQLPSLNWLDLTGGEITLRSDLLEVLGAIIEASPYLRILHLTSNGQKPNTLIEAIRFCKNQQINPIVSISIDGPEALHDEIRGKSGAFESAVRTYRQIRNDPDLNVSISCTLSVHNLDSVDLLLKELQGRLAEFSHDEIHFNLFHESNHFYGNTGHETLSRADFAQIQEQLYKAENGHLIKRMLEHRYRKASRDYFLYGRHGLKCQSLSSTCFLDSDGTLYPCTIYDRPLGNLRDYHYDCRPLWNDQHTMALRDEIMQSNCPGCCSPCETYPAIVSSLFIPGTTRRRSPTNQTRSG